MTDKKEISILLLGIVAILAIVGLVLLFTSPAATGKAYFPPPLGPQVQSPAPVGYGPVPGEESIVDQQAGQISNAIYVTALEGANLPRCPNGEIRTRRQGNIAYEAIPGYYCDWFYCATLASSPSPAVQPIMACVTKP
ncbi:Uncharacterised protein [uncultured archaeon]|nr:Uncharacterised protein [uncultured archaeon]